MLTFYILTVKLNYSFSHVRVSCPQSRYYVISKIVHSSLKSNYRGVEDTNVQYLSEKMEKYVIFFVILLAAFNPVLYVMQLCLT